MRLWSSVSFSSVLDIVRLAKLSPFRHANVDTGTSWSNWSQAPSRKSAWGRRRRLGRRREIRRYKQLQQTRQWDRIYESGSQTPSVRELRSQGQEHSETPKRMTQTAMRSFLLAQTLEERRLAMQVKSSSRLVADMSASTILKPRRKLQPGREITGGRGQGPKEAWEGQHHRQALWDGALRPKEG